MDRHLLVEPLQLTIKNPSLDDHRSRVGLFISISLMIAVDPFVSSGSGYQFQSLPFNR